MWEGLRGWLWQWRGAIASIPSVTAILALLRVSGALQPLELAAYDALLRWRPPEQSESRVAIVGVTETDITETFASPLLTDGELAQLIERIDRANPRVIGLDLYRDLAIPPGSDRLQAVFENTPHLIGIQKVVGRDGEPPPGTAPILRELGQVGANDVPIDRDGKLRRAFLYVRSRDGETVMGWGLRLAQQYLDAEAIAPEAAPHDANVMQLGDAVLPPFQGNDGGYMGADDSGYQILIHYRNQEFTRVSVTDIRSGRVSPELFRDRVVLIGYVAESANDFHLTPFGRLTGVEVQAHITAHLLAAALGESPVLRTLSEPLEWLAIVAAITVTSLVSWQKRHQFTLSHLSRSLWLSWGSLIAVVVAVTEITFWMGWWLPVVPMLLGIVGSAAAIAIYLAASATQMRQIFGRYITDEVVATLLETPEGLNFKCRRQVVTILISDLRGFSTLSEQLSPERVVELLDIYLGAMTDIITQYQGTINEFMGDGILVFFGAPTIADDDADRAVACALAMEAAMPDINHKLQQKQLPPVQMGIGLNTGEVVVGNIGSLKRAKWSVVGASINLAARIESCTVGGQVLISEVTKDCVFGDLNIAQALTIEMKGFAHPIAIYDIRGITGKYQLQLATNEKKLFPLSEPVDVQYRELSGKSVGERSHVGQIVQLSNSGAVIRGTSVEDPLTNLKIYLLDSNSTGEIYAKVTKCNPDKSNEFYVSFTATTPLLDALLAQNTPTTNPV